jgi:hypothetical protein
VRITLAVGAVVKARAHHRSAAATKATEANDEDAALPFLRQGEKYPALHLNLRARAGAASSAPTETKATAAGHEGRRYMRRKADPSRPPECGGVPFGWAPFLRQGKQGRPFRCQGKRDDNVKKGGSSGEWL